MKTLDKVLYTARVHTTGGGRDGGQSRSDDGHLDVTHTPPGKGSGTNPEQLFAAGFAACFHSALQLVARRNRTRVDGSSVTGSVGIGPLDGGPGFGLQVSLEVRVPGLPREQALALVAQADAVCPYSNATRGNIVTTHHVVDSEAEPAR